MLTRLGDQVAVAGDGVEALGVADTFGGDIDLVLSDIVMPRMDGRELARRLAGSPADDEGGFTCPATPATSASASRPGTGAP